MIRGRHFWTAFAIVAVIGAVLIGFAAQADGARSGGGSVVSATRPYEAAPFVIGAGIITRLGPKVRGAYSISLYRMKPRAKVGNRVATTSGQVRGGQQISVATRAACKGQRRKVRWFTVLVVNSRAWKGAKLRRITSKSQTTALRCR